MKIGLVSSHSFFRPGGVKNHILNLQRELEKRGHICKIIAPRSLKEKNYGKNIILLGTSFRLPVAGHQGDFTFCFTPGSIGRLLKKEKFDLLHFHNVGVLASQIWNNSNLPETSILTWHASLEGANYFKYLPFAKSLMLRIIENRIDGIIGVAPFNLDLFKNMKKPKAVIPNGINLDEFRPGVSKIKEYRDGKINILFLGRIEERKGLIYLLRAYKILQKRLGQDWTHSNLRLIVFGEGPQKEYSENWAKENNLKNVVFEQKVRKGLTVASYYASSDIYCSPAIYGESFGIVLVEAMAVGKPVVAFANAGYKTVLGKGKGKKFLARPKDYRGLAKRLEILIKNKKLREEMGRWGIQESKKYSWPKIAGRILDFYKLCIEKK